MINFIRHDTTIPNRLDVSLKALEYLNVFSCKCKGNRCTNGGFIIELRGICVCPIQKSEHLEVFDRVIDFNQTPPALLSKTEKPEQRYRRYSNICDGMDLKDGYT